MEIELVDQVLRCDSELLQVRDSVEHALDLGIAPHLVIAHSHEPPTLQPGGAHLAVRGWELLQHGLVHPLPVRAVGDRAALVSPPDDVAAVDHKFGPPRFDVLHNFAGHPFAALKPEHRTMYAGKQFYVLDRRLG